MSELSVSDNCFMKCNTCKAVFSSVAKVKEHYKTDWHVVNSKRRANNLVPLRKEEFKTLGIKLPPTKPLNVSKNNNVLPINNNIKTTSVIEINDTVKDSTAPSTNIFKLGDIGEDINDDDTEWVDEDESVAASPVASNICLFDDKKFENTEECIQYMAIQFGFFIPDMEYLTDMDGFLNYLGEKVKHGGFCLYCQRKFRTARSCQHHMLSKSHCKIAYEEGVDMEEFEDFYDFSSSYEDIDDENMEIDEDGNVLNNEMKVSHLGELILPNGRVVGNRAFRLYYKQRYSQPDTRPCILAQQREELLRLGYKFGPQTQLPSYEVNNLSDIEVMTMLVKYHKDIRRGQIVEQRCKERRDYIDQRREYKSTVDKLRSSATTTAKIRDYHKIL
eukprot:gene7624-10378_t